MTASNGTKQGNVKDDTDLISDKFREIFLMVNFSIVCQAIDTFGTVTNIINIVCFVKQGFRDPVNITLFALSISDLFCLITLIWNNIVNNPLFYYLPLPFDPWEIVYITAGWPHTAFARISACITAFITTERCLCVVFPLQVKTMITRKRVTILIIGLYIVLLCSISPIFYFNQFVWRFYSQDNMSVLQLDEVEDADLIEDITYAINNVAIPCLTYTVVIVTTAVLVVKLRKKTRWRVKSTAQGKSDAISNRDQKVSKMVIMMSVVFISCYGPICVIFLAMIVENDLSIYGRYSNTFGIVFSIVYLMESISISMNIFIYYKMSSRYKVVFRKMFCLRTNTDTEYMRRDKSASQSDKKKLST